MKLMLSWRKKRRPFCFLPCFMIFMTKLLLKKDTISLKDITTSLLSNKIRRRLNIEGGQYFGLVGRVENCKGRSFVRGFGNNRSKSK